MTRKPNFWKCILGVTLLVVMAIGTWAAIYAPSTSAEKVSATTNAARGGAKVKSPQAANAPDLYSPVAIATPTPVGDIFELDKNAVDDASPLDDWETLNNGGGSAIATTLDANGNPVEIPDLGGQTIFTTGGSKDDLDISQWRHKAGNVPPKDEITNAYAAAYQSGTDTYVVFGADRFAQNGDAVIGFWFFQNEVSLITTGPDAGKFNGVHKNGDVLILSDFSQGGGEVTIRVFKWNAPGGAIDGTLDLIGTGFGCTNSPLFCAEVNTAPTPSPWAYTPSQGPANIFPTGAFFEGGINLTQLGITNVCFSSFLAETRSSTSVDATLKDFVTGTFTLVPDVDAGADANINCTTPTTQLTASSSLEPNATFHWTTSDGNIVGNPDQKTITVDKAGTYQVEVNGPTGCSNTDTVVVTEDFTKPNVSAGPDKVLTCSITSIQLSGSSTTTGATFAWSTVDGHIVSGANTATPTVDAPGTYHLVVTNPANGCFDVDDAVVTSDITPPSLSIQKTGANENTNPQTVSLGFVGSPPAGVTFQWQSCVANCGVDASWSNIASQTGSTLTFSNFALDTAESVSFAVGSGNGSGNYVALLQIVNLRVAGTQTSNGCSANSNGVAVKKLLAIDP
ncbi:MAG TPA: hypothetical protein VFM63_06275 [Pyrinomonadaceae bacterium]|nr:hypothetical protein [Pyrinomonadaceae bacterium]